jgi:hypothetical protein
VIDKPLPRYLDVLLPDAVADTNLRFLPAAAVLQVLVVVLAQLQPVGSRLVEAGSTPCRLTPEHPGGLG